MQKPFVATFVAAAAVAKQPAAQTHFGHDAVVVALNMGTAPPASLDTLGPDADCDRVLRASKTKGDRWTFRNQCGNGNCNRMEEQPQGA